MEHFKNILVVYDQTIDNRTLYEHAVELGQRNEARVAIIEVVERAACRAAETAQSRRVMESHTPGAEIIEEFPSDVGVAETIRPAVDVHQREGIDPKGSLHVQERNIQAEKRCLEEFVTEMRQAGVQVTSKMVQGTPLREIVREAVRNRHDLVMLMAENGRRLKDMVFGSTATNLIRNCPCPVWVVKRNSADKPAPILAGVDVMLADKEGKALSDQIINIAISLAKFDRTELIIIHAWVMYGESVLRSRRSMLRRQEVDEVIAETRDAHRRTLAELLQRHRADDLKCQVYMLKGDADRLIPELARNKRAKLIVMGTLRRSGIAGLLAGQTVEKVLHRADCSVLAVKPEGFASLVIPDAA